MLGFKVFISYREILGQLDYANEVIYTEKISSEDGFTTIPFGSFYNVQKHLSNYKRKSISKIC